jgi:hypothetical protein
MKYTKKPVEIEAIQLTVSNVFDVLTFIEGKEPRLNSNMAYEKWEQYVDLVRNEGLKLKTLESDGETQTADIGDYIIKGVKGEFYPCKPDIFALTYDAVK